MKTGVFDQLNGIFVLPVEYDQFSRIDDGKGYFMTRIGKQYGFYIASTGKLLPPVYNYTGRHFKSQWFVACSATAGYVFDDQLTPVDTIQGMSSVRARFMSGRNKWMVATMPKGEGLVDTANRLIYQKEWIQLLAIKGSILVVKTEKGIGWYNLETGKLVKPYQYTQYIVDPGETNMYFSKASQWAVLDRQGRLAMEFTADSVKLSNTHYADGIYFKRGGLWGLMNRKGHIIQKPAWKKVTEQYFSTTDVLFPDGRLEKMDWVFNDVNGEYLLTGLKKAIPVTEQDTNAGYQTEMPMVTSLPDAPGPPAAEEQNKIYQKMEIDPSFPRGSLTEAAYLKNAIDQYKKEKKIKKTGKVTLRLVIEKDGTVSLTEIVSSADASLTEASKAILKTITNWTPGQQNGRPVRGEKTLVFEW